MTSPSGVHLGHLKAYFAPHSLIPGSYEANVWEKKRQELLKVHLGLLNYALRTGYSFSRWKTIVNSMIEKDPGNPRIHRLRVIHLYEADYNLILGVKWRQLMHHATQNKLLNESQYGAVAGKSALEPVFIEELELEICRASRKPLGKNDFDATACYDRIIAGLAHLVSRKYGMNKTICIVAGTTLAEAKYHLKTQMGMSDECYKHCKFHPIYGTGQGSGNSPVLWLVVSSVLFDIHKQKANGAIFETMDGLESIILYMIGFVDDSNGQTNFFCAQEPPSDEEMIEAMRHDAQTWNDLLWCSGGELELSKSSYHLISFQFTAAGKPVMKAGQVGPDLMLQSREEGKPPVKIQHRSNFEAHKTLGTHKSPSGRQKKQRDVLRQKSDDFARVVKCGHISRKEATAFYRAIYLTSMGYPLPVCFFNKSELSRIQQKAMVTLKSKMGYNSRTANAIIYGPTRLGGCGFRHLYVEQGMGQIHLFLRHWRSNSQAGRLLRIALCWVQFSAGTGKPILQDTKTHLPYLES